MEGISDFNLDTDIGDYAETAAGDLPSVSRTYQSEEQFQAIRAGYTAKTDNMNSYASLLDQIPSLRAVDKSTTNIRLDKKQQLLLGYAAAELYFTKQYAELLDLCGRVTSRCQVDARLAKSLDRWSGKCKDKLG